MTTERWILFDLDGTLFDYAAAEEAAVRATLRQAGLEPTPEVVADYRRENAALWAALERGETTPDRLRVERWDAVLRQHAALDVDPAALSSTYVTHLGTGTQLLPGAREVLEQVSREHRIAYITNGLADVQRPRLAASALDRYAEVTVISDEIGVAKPDPAIFAAALRQMGEPSVAAVTMVGDSLSADVAGGLAAGLETVWLAPPGTPAPGEDDPVPTHRIADLRELPGVLAR